MFSVCYAVILRGGGRASGKPEAALAVKCGGGIGDVLAAALYLSRLALKMDCPYTMTFFSKQSIKSIQAMFHSLEFISAVRSYNDCAAEDFDMVIELGGQYPRIFSAKKNELKRRSTFLPQYVEALETFALEVGPAFFKASATPQQQLKCFIDGTTRLTAMDVGGLVGLKQDDGLALTVPQEGFSVLERCGLSSVPFVTVMRGVDANNASPESTRLWPVEYYAKLVRLLKQRWPHVKIVQLGVSRERCLAIPGVDIDLRGETSFAEAMALLCQSALLIDCECGMPHLRHFLCGKVSAVLFGPTSPRTKSYPENINIRSSVCPCETCEWAVGETWQSYCLRSRSPVADCMLAIEPEYVIQKIVEQEHRIFAD